MQDPQGPHEVWSLQGTLERLLLRAAIFFTGKGACRSQNTTRDNKRHKIGVGPSSNAKPMKEGLQHKSSYVHVLPKCTCAHEGTCIIWRASVSVHVHVYICSGPTLQFTYLERKTLIWDSLVGHGTSAAARIFSGSVSMDKEIAFENEPDTHYHTMILLRPPGILTKYRHPCVSRDIHMPIHSRCLHHASA